MFKINQSTDRAPKLILNKGQGLVKRDNTSVPSVTPGNCDNNEAIPNISAVKTPDPKPRIQKDNLRRSTRVRIPSKKYPVG